MSIPEKCESPGIVLGFLFFWCLLICIKNLAERAGLDTGSGLSHSPIEGSAPGIARVSFHAAAPLNSYIQLSNIR